MSQAVKRIEAIYTAITNRNIAQAVTPIVDNLTTITNSCDNNHSGVSGKFLKRLNFPMFKVIKLM